MEITFKKDYTISPDGISNKAMSKGDKLNLSEDWANRLISQGIAEAVEIELIENKVISPTKTRSRRK